LVEYKVFVGNRTNIPMERCKNQLEGHGGMVIFTCDYIVGRYIKVKIKNANNLALCEVGVYED
jgi:hypothetical protein